MDPDYQIVKGQTLGNLTLASHTARAQTNCNAQLQHRREEPFSKCTALYSTLIQSQTKVIIMTPLQLTF